MRAGSQKRVCGACRWLFGAVGMSCFLPAMPTVAQISVGLKLENVSLMVNEPSSITIVIQNNSETPLVFNKTYNNAELQVCVLRESSSVSPGYVTLNRDFVVMPDDSITELVELTSLTDIHAPGNYRVKVRVRYDGDLYEARPRAFDVVHGIELGSRTRSLSGYRDIQLTYSLRYCSRDRAEYAFLVVEDVDRGASYGTFKLGPSLRVNPPAMQFDDQGRFAVVHQSGRNRFTRSVIEVNRDGASFVEQTHHLPSGKPYPNEAPRSLRLNKTLPKER